MICSVTSRVLLVVLALGLLVAGSAQALTGNYSTGNIDRQIGASLDTSVTVPQRGPVSFLRASFRITAPDTSALSVSLVSPKGTEVPLVVGRGAGADFGSDEKSCGGLLTVVESDMRDNPIAGGQAPFIDGPYHADGNLASLFGQDARGKWTLRIVNTGGPAELRCFSLDVSRAVPQTLTGTDAGVAAKLSFTERNYQFGTIRLSVARHGRTVLDTPLQKLPGCRDCAQSRPVGVAVRDLDGGEPEVLVDLFTGGAHCCSVTLILRWDAAAKRYRSDLEYWGNYGRRIADLDHDGLPELVAYDERFVYAYTAYVFSSAPPQIWDYRAGNLVDVTRSFPAEIRKSAAYALKQFAKLKGPSKDFDPRSFVAVYVADEFLLGNDDVAKKALQDAVASGVVYGGKSYLGLPAGNAFANLLMSDLKKWGYLRG
jgi:hypothetical protein